MATSKILEKICNDMSWSENTDWHSFLSLLSSNVIHR